MKADKFLEKVQKKGWWLASISAFFLLLAFLIMSNLSIGGYGEYEMLKKGYVIASWLGIKDNEHPEDALMVSISYDRQWIDIHDEYDFPIGQIDITDRGKLRNFLEVLDSLGTYKGILLDVRFEKDKKTVEDARLFSLIAKMPRIVIPNHDGIEIADESLLTSTGMADYTTTLSQTDFVKYPIINGGRPSIAWMMESFRDSLKFPVIFGLAFSEGHIMRTSLVPYLHISDVNNYAQDKVTKQIYYLGADLLENPEIIESLVKDRMIYIGDFTKEDIHSTYRGDMAGVVILANVVENLLQQKHLYSWWFIILLYLLLWGLSYIAIRKPFYIERYVDLQALDRRAAKSPWWFVFQKIASWFISLFGYGTILILFGIILFLTTKAIYELSILSIPLVILDRMTSLRKLR
ncbi:MAG: CHASE2 domain-containing protein [Bacteroidales bacterium]|nr:CHASE2 domain-containing protein [Bacteroidales bacterium]